MTKCIIELKRIYGIRQGSAGQPHTDNLNGKTQSDLAKQFNISQQQLQNYKKLTTLIPELQSMVEHDALKSTTAYKIWTKLSPDEHNVNEAKTQSDLVVRKLFPKQNN
nr:hypothetical protein [Clostridium tyrobutyricum]